MVRRKKSGLLVNVPSENLAPEDILRLEMVSEVEERKGPKKIYGLLKLSSFGSGKRY